MAEVSRDRALVVRLGYGSGDEVADGRYGEAHRAAAPRARRVKRSMEAPEERFAALLGGREEIHPAEELVLRARADLNAGRPARGGAPVPRGPRGAPALRAAPTSCRSHREVVAAAANAALSGTMPGEHAAELEDAVAAMERALKRRRLGA